MCEICNEDLADSVHGEHVVFCNDDATCDIDAACDADLYAWAAHLLNGATECEATSASIASAIERHGREAWEKLIEEQRADLCEYPHETCRDCGSVSWDIENRWLKDSDAECSACNTRFGAWYVIPYTRHGEDDIGDTGAAIYFARNRKTVQGGEHDSGSWDAYVSDVTEELWGKHVTDSYDTGSAEHSDAGYVYLTRECDCGDDGCWSRLTEKELQGNGSDHESLTTAITWDASTDFREFKTLDEARKYAETELREHAPVVIGEECGP